MSIPDNNSLKHTWSELTSIQEYIEREFVNLHKSKNRPRTQEGINTKKSLLQESLKRFETLITRYESCVSDRDWNKLTDVLDAIKTKVHQSFKILEQTEVIQSSKRRHSDTGIYTEVILPSRFFEPIEDQSGDLDNQPLSSTRVNERLEDTTDQVAESSNAGFKQQLNNIKKGFLETSQTLGKVLNSSIPKMAFSQITALQCIPIFDGQHEDLEPFIAQLDLFATQVEGLDHTPLLNVIWMKLKGKALQSLPNLKAETWPEVKANLIREFQPQKNSGALMREMETLLQRPNESFNEYKSRGEELYKWIEGEGPFALSSLRKHFLGGLRNKGIAQAGKSQRDKTFPELLNWLKEECEEGDEIKEINARAERLNISESNRSFNTQSKQSLKNTNLKKFNNSSWHFNFERRDNGQNSRNNFSQNHHPRNYNNDNRNQYRGNQPNYSNNSFKKNDAQTGNNIPISTPRYHQYNQRNFGQPGYSRNYSDEYNDVSNRPNNQREYDRNYDNRLQWNINKPSQSEHRASNQYPRKN